MKNNGLVRGMAVATVLASVLATRTSAAQAEHTEHPAVVVWVEGPGSDAARAQVNTALGSDFTLANAAKWRAALTRQGQRGPVGADVQSPKKSAAAIDRVRRAMKAAGVDDAVLIVTSRGAAGSASASVLVVDAKSSDRPEPTRVAMGAGHEDALERAVRQALPGPPPAVATEDASASAPQPSTDRAAASAAAALSASSDRDAGAVAAAAPRHAHEVGEEIVQISAGVEGAMRHFNYNDGLTGNLRSYQLSAAPLVAAEGSIYPFMALGTPVLRDVGVVLGYARAFALQSTASGAGAVDTQWSRYSVGGHVRARTGSGASPILGLTGAYGDESFGFTGTSASSLPSVDYRFVRASGDVRVPIGRFALFAQAGYLFVLSAGDVAARFPKATVGGVEGELGGAFTLMPGLEARVTASYRRFFYSMNPTPGDGYVAGGALDEFGGLLASVAYVY